jgi:hypothetical protein
MPPTRLAALVFAALLGCESNVQPLTESSQDLVTTNGRSLNGRSLNGRSLNGVSLGSTVAAVSFDEVQLRGMTLESTWLNGTIFVGQQGETIYSGSNFRGAHFSAVTDTGVPLELRIDSMGHEAPPNADVWTYQVSFRVPPIDAAENGNDGDARGVWSPICANDSGVAVAAIPVNGRWDYRSGVPGGGDKIADPSSFTFACKGLGAIAKCVDPIGYKPWKMVKGVSLDRWHQACVRLIRGDYCGDGTPYTHDGERVDIYDGVGVQSRTELLWLIEAEWDEAGARCFNVYNRSHALLVPCFNDRALAACGLPIDFQLGALLMNDTPLPIVSPLPILR